MDARLLEVVDRPPLDLVDDLVDARPMGLGGGVGAQGLAVDHLEKPRIRSRPDEEKQLLRQIADGTAEPGRERRIVKSKRFASEPRFEEDAIARMEELGHEFFVYVDAQSERVHILYRRQDGDYGMIEPIVAGEYTKGRGKAGARSNGRH